MLHLWHHNVIRHSVVMVGRVATESARYGLDSVYGGRWNLVDRSVVG